MKDHVWVMGDYLNSNCSRFGAYSELEVKVNYFKLQGDAYDGMEDWMSEVEDAGGDITAEECDAAEDDEEF